MEAISLEIHNENTNRGALFNPQEEPRVADAGPDFARAVNRGRPGGGGRAPLRPKPRGSLHADLDQAAPIRTVYPAAVLGPDDPTLSPANQALRTFVRYLAFSTSSGFQLIDVRDLATVQVRLLDLEGRAAPEGKGYLLSVVYRGSEKRSDLAIFDAQSLSAGPIACAELPHRVPFGFHGNWKYNE